MGHRHMPKPDAPWQITFCKIGRNCQTSQIREYANASTCKSDEGKGDRVESMCLGHAELSERQFRDVRDSSESLLRFACKCDTSDSRAVNAIDEIHFQKILLPDVLKVCSN